MEINVTEGEEAGLPTPAVSLEISSEIAERAEKLLSEFAEDAGLETALIVDRGGALVAGISSEEDVTVDVISGLVAGASSAMRALVDQLGDTGEIESLHQGGKRLLYIREIVTRFVLVGVSDASFPPGIVREKASQLQPNLADLLRDVKPLDPPEPEPSEKPKSLRAVAAERAAARVKVEILQKGSSSEKTVEEENSEPEEADKIFEKPSDTEDADQDDIVDNEADEKNFTPEAAEEEIEDEMPTSEPVEVLEPIDTGEPEIVIEQRSTNEEGGEESPFELEDGDKSTEEKDEPIESALEPTESIFELEDEVEEPETPAEGSVFEWVEEEEESIDETPEEGEETAETVFEFDGRDDEEGGEEEEVISESNPEEPEESDDEETESRSSGPLYF